MNMVVANVTLLHKYKFQILLSFSGVIVKMYTGWTKALNIYYSYKKQENQQQHFVKLTFFNIIFYDMTLVYEKIYV